MFRSPQLLTKACLLGTHRSQKPTFGTTLYSISHSQQFCKLKRKKGDQWEPHKNEPLNSDHVSGEILLKSNSCPVHTNCSVKPTDPSQNVIPQERMVKDVNAEIVSHRLGNTTEHYSDTICSKNFIHRDSVPNKCLLPENRTDKHRGSVRKWRAHLHTSINSQEVFHAVINTCLSSRISRPDELGRSLCTLSPGRWRQCGLLTTQTCGLHHEVPHQATLEDYLSAENETRCKRHLQPNSALYEKEKEKSRAAVLVSLCTVRGEPSFLFTLRSSKLRGRHKGDVSFAGGKRDPSDKNVVDTALREAKEELGITVAENVVWGVLKPLHDVSGMMVAPVLANLGPVEALTFRPNPTEVEEIFTLTVAHLCNPLNQGYTNFRKSDRHIYTLPVFHNSKYRIWGLTAVALDHTLKLIMPV